MTKRLPVHAIDATGTRDATTYLRGDGTWAEAEGSGIGTSGPEYVYYDTIDITAYHGQSDASQQLNLVAVSHVASNEATHPSVLRFPQLWNGWRYWMAFTPYPGGNDDHEDPCVAVSQDGTTWELPAGFTNPLDDVTGSTGNSDTELVMSPDGLTMYCLFRTFNGTTETLYVRSTTDGVTWTTKASILTLTTASETALSPTIVHDGTNYVMWYVDMVPSPNVIKRRTCSTMTGTWSSATTCTVSGLPGGRDLWHLAIKKLGSQYIALLNDCTSGVSGTDGELYLMRSTDQTTWTLHPTPVVSQALTGKYDSNYRGSLVPVYENGRLEFDMYHGSWMSGGTPVWGIWRQRLAQTSTAAAYSLTVQDENSNVSTSVTQIDFQGAGVTTTSGTGEVVVTIPGASSTTSGEVLMQDGVTGPPVPIETEARDDWLYFG